MWRPPGKWELFSWQHRNFTSLHLFTLWLLNWNGLRERCKCHGCWFPGSLNRQAINRSDIDYTISQEICTKGFCFAVLCCGYTLTDFPISTRLTSLALWQSNDCPSASKATLMNMDKYFMWNHYEWLHNHNKAKHNKTVCIFIGIYCMQNNDVLVDGKCSYS